MVETVFINTICAKTYCSWYGSGGGASGRDMAFCPCRLCSNTGTDLAFSVQNSCFSILAGCRAFCKNE